MSNSQMKIRVPSSVKEFIEKEAKNNLRSMNAEIVFLISEKMKEAAGQHAVGSQSPATTNNNTAMVGDVSITQDKRTI